MRAVGTLKLYRGIHLRNRTTHDSSLNLRASQRGLKVFGIWDCLQTPCLVGDSLSWRLPKRFRGRWCTIGSRNDAGRTPCLSPWSGQRRACARNCTESSSEWPRPYGVPPPLPVPPLTLAEAKLTLPSARQPSSKRIIVRLNEL